jgi:hypothetical protein
MYRTMVRKQHRSGALVLCLLLSAGALPGLEQTIELGKESLWKDMQTMDGVLTLPGRWGFKDLALADGAYTPDSSTDILLHFDAAPVADATGAWKLVRGQPILSSANSAHGRSSAAFTGSRQGIGFQAPPDSLFGAGAVWGDFTVEFWLFPATLADGEPVLSWTGSARDAPGAPLLNQSLQAVIRDRKIAWEFRNLFVLPTGERVPVDLVGTRQILPRAWHHHLLRYNSREGLLEYMIDGVPEAITHVTDTGRETGSVAVPAVGAVYAGPLILGAGFTGLLDELRISRRFVDDAILTRFLGRTGAATSRIIDLGFSSTRVARIDAVDAKPSDSAVEYYYQAAETWNGKAMLKGETDWVPFIPGADLGVTLKARYLQVRVELYPDGSRTASPRVSSLAVVYEPNTPPAPPAGLTVTPGNGKVTLSWRRVNDINARGYLVYYGTAPNNFLGTGASAGDSPIDAGAVTSLEIGGLTNGTLYYFAVAAYDASSPRQQSDFSPAVSARPSRIYN